MTLKEEAKKYAKAWLICAGVFVAAVLGLLLFAVPPALGGHIAGEFGVGLGIIFDMVAIAAAIGREIWFD